MNNQMVLILAMVTVYSCLVQGQGQAADCLTPDGLSGECVAVNSCPRIKAMLTKKPVPRENIEYARNSRCEGPETYSVCCQLQGAGSCNPSAAPLSRGSGCCGVAAAEPSRILGGNTTEIDQYPWVALIEYKGEDQKTRLLCGGALISGRYVLTAAHCVTGAVLKKWTPVNIRLGEFDISSEGPDCVQLGGILDCTESTTTIPIEATIVHPKYDVDGLLPQHDIALLRMKRLAPFTDFIRPICLPSIDVKTLATDEIRLFLAGWGHAADGYCSNVKQHASVSYINLEQCQSSLNAQSPNISLSSGFICTGMNGASGGKSDSGGPLMLENRLPRAFELIGVSNFRQNTCSVSNLPNVYADVYEYKSWITSQIKP